MSNSNLLIRAVPTKEVTSTQVDARPTQAEKS